MAPLAPFDGDVQVEMSNERGCHQWWPMAPLEPMTIHLIWDSDDSLVIKWFLWRHCDNGFNNDNGYNGDNGNNKYNFNDDSGNIGANDDL